MTAATRSSSIRSGLAGECVADSACARRHASDEPTGALDYETGKLVLNAIDRINRELGTTTAVITHNVAIAGMADRVVRMTSGRISDDRRNERRISAGDLSW